MVRFYPDRPDVLVKVRWYFVPPDSPKLAYPNVFTPRTWSDGSGMTWPLLGEVNGAPREWTRGDPPPGLKDNSCQTNAGVWIDGVPYSLHDSAPYDASGVLLCCLETVVVAVIDIYSPDNSIFVSPHDGHVLEIINPSHTNNWLIVQTFKPAVANQPALVVNELASQTADVLQVLAFGGTPILSVDPAVSLILQGRAPGNEVLHVKDSAGTSVFEIRDDGAFGTVATVATGTPTTLAGFLPVYDMGGTLIGNMPLYDTVSAGTITVEDNFTGTTGDPFVGRVPDTTNVHNGRWAAEWGSWQILSNQLQDAATSFNWDFGLIECGWSDGTVQVDVPNDTAGWLFCIARAVSDRQCVVAGIRSADSIGIYTFANNQFHLLNSASYTRTGGAVSMKLKMIGPELRLEVGSSNVTAVSAMGLDITVHGLGANDSGALFSKFKFTV
jgi:hypothetical protein